MARLGLQRQAELEIALEFGGDAPGKSVGRQALVQAFANQPFGSLLFRTFGHRRYYRFSCGYPPTLIQSEACAGT